MGLYGVKDSLDCKYIVIEMAKNDPFLNYQEEKGKPHSKVSIKLEIHFIENPNGRTMILNMNCKYIVWIIYIYI